jgi:2-oxoglutarate ferredoxin oxidoreductase subunit alpha
MKKEFMKGNEAIAEAAIKCGVRHFYGYPITPQNEIPEYMSHRMVEVGGTFIQAESEVAAMNMVYGAAGSGARVLTSSSSPGMSLKMEALSYIAGADLPCVLVNICRAGPGLGGLAASQGDYFQAVKGGGHGDYRCLVLAPRSVQEAVNYTQLAFDLTDKYRMPAIILGDAVLGQMLEPVIIEEKTPIKTDKSWATTGWKDKSKPRSIINSQNLDVLAFEKTIKARYERYGELAKECTLFDTINAEDCEILVVAYGLAGRIAGSVLNEFGKELRVGLFCPLSLFPYPYDKLHELAKGKKLVLCAEMSMGQMYDDVRIAVNGVAPTQMYGRTGGVIPTEEEIYDVLLKIKEAL